MHGTCCGHFRFLLKILSARILLPDFDGDSVEEDGEEKRKDDRAHALPAFQGEGREVFLYYSKARAGAISNTGIQRSGHHPLERTTKNRFSAVRKLLPKGTNPDNHQKPRSRHSKAGSRPA